MDCIYINLDAQPDRRTAIESNFDTKKIEGWRLTRFQAVDVNQVHAMNIAGNARPAEKACFTSHKNLIEANVGRSDPVLIMEDDSIFGSRTCRAIEVGLSNIDPDSWDILFTDICVPNVGAWADLIRMHREFVKSGELKFIDLSQMQFAGSTSYILNPRSIAKLIQIFENIATIDVGYDLYIRNLTYAGIIRASAFVPFVTSVSALSEQSSIQENDDASIGKVLDLFRRMIWLDRDLSSHSGAIDSLISTYSNVESRMFAALFEAMISEQLHWR